ncbi:hypothetical protein HS088_TW06G00805 [Tripterygium wilfordii]|uniref:RNase H type-1 domain-containing protein n=1 Tax=Tripterygium wilfordii TaxID=458696 RepID=A0A7J7DK61_TRIWF|nr:hypothetical protein HS088_TW06G00805 [Tripterygium wilfordii]
MCDQTPTSANNQNGEVQINVGMIFNNANEAYDACNMYAINKGFGVRRGKNIITVGMIVAPIIYKIVAHKDQPWNNYWFTRCSASTLKGKFGCAGLRAEINKEFEFSRFRVQCFSSKSRKTPRTRKLETEPAVMEQDKDDGFFVVRKGDVVGVYKSFADCQAQLGSSICDPPVSVYKGYSLKKETEDYLTSCGLRDAIYTIRAADLKDDLFGTLTPCPLQEPAFSKDETSSKDRSKKRPYEMGGSQNIDPVCTTSFSTDSLKKHVKMDAEAHEPSSDIRSCILEFDGASKGNPGQAGAGAVLRANDGSVICRLREGLGIATNNVAEYRAMILGLKYALKKGYKSIRVQGDSKLVCMQIQGLWKVKHENMSWLCKEATKLKDKFLSFQIGHVFRDLNSEADAQANLAISLADGQVVEELGK